MKCIAITVYGKVQGVWYRASTQKKAMALGVCGQVRNQADGSVYIEAEGEETALDIFKAWCKEGPPHARVDRIESTERNLQGFSTFQVIR